MNLEYSSQLYKVLSLFEVFLRNSINNQLSIINTNWIIKLNNLHIQILHNVLNTSTATEKTVQTFKEIFSIQENLIENVSDDLKLDKKPITNNNMVSRLTFGFWTRLFNKTYEDMLWKKYLHKVFSVKLTRKKVEHTLNEFRWLRNRIAHNEPILYMKHTPQDYYKRVIEFIELIDNDLAKFAKKTVSQDLFD